jgi:hypothetical protein
MTSSLSILQGIPAKLPTLFIWPSESKSSTHYVQFHDEPIYQCQYLAFCGLFLADRVISGYRIGHTLVHGRKLVFYLHGLYPWPLVWKHTQKTAGQASVSSSCHCKFAVLGVMRIQASSYMTLHEHRRAASVAKINILMCADLHAQKSCRFACTKKSSGADSQNYSWPQKHAYAALLTHKKLRCASVMLILHG